MMCRLLGVSRSGYDAWRARPEPARLLEDQQMRVLIAQIFWQHRRRYGAVRVWRELAARGVACGRDRVARLMKQDGLVAVASRSKAPRTTDRAPEDPCAPNLLARQFEVAELDQVWLADLTYVATRRGWLYLACVMDLCSRRIVGWSMREDLSGQGPLDALEMALVQRRPPAGLLHHSDRGSQYTSAAYRARLASACARSSMSRRGHCWDNAPMESFFGRMKEEMETTCFETHDEARQALFEYIELYYNRQRRHSGLDYVSPHEFETKKAA